jgi:hypothetical protein
MSPSADAERLNARPLSIPRKQSPNGGKPLTNIYSALLVVHRRLKRSIPRSGAVVEIIDPETGASKKV